MNIIVLAGFGIAYGLFSANPDLPLDPFEPPPYSYGTEYDCRIAVPKYGADDVWFGRISGRVSDDGIHIKQISDTACFATRHECKAWLAFWNGKIGEVFQNSCKLGYRG